MYNMLSDKKLIMLRPSEIKLSPNQPRKSFDEYELKLLSDSIRSSGIIQPLSVRKNADGEYELIAGERRLRAAVNAAVSSSVFAACRAYYIKPTRKQRRFIPLPKICKEAILPCLRSQRV